MPNRSKVTKETPGSKFVNKTHEVYHFIHSNPGKNEREILDALKHMNAPVVHASLKSLSDGGYLTKTETSDLNKLGRKMNRYKVVASKPYEPRFSRGSSGGAKKTITKPRQADGEVESARPKGSIMDQTAFTKASARSTGLMLTVPTANGPVSMHISEAQDVYNELKKLFGAR